MGHAYSFVIATMNQWFVISTAKTGLLSIQWLRILLLYFWDFFNFSLELKKTAIEFVAVIVWKFPPLCYKLCSIVMLTFSFAVTSTESVASLAYGLLKLANLTGNLRTVFDLANNNM